MKTSRLLSAIAIVVFCTNLFSQSISGTAVDASGGPLDVAFTATNGNGTGNHYNASSNLSFYLSNAGGTNYVPVHSFTSPTYPPSSNGASSTINRSFIVPSGTPSGSGYKLYAVSANPTATGAPSPVFTLFCDFSMPTNLSGFIKSSSPAVTFYLITITNTGNLPDIYTLTKTQTPTLLQSQFYDLSGIPISSTPIVNPDDSYTFMIRFDTPNGTQPNNTNTTNVIATSTNCPGTSHTTVISTYIYGGNGNGNIPNAADMQIVKTASPTNTLVGNVITYNITIKNISPQTAANPVIKDFLPANADLISYNKAAGETRNVIFTLNTAANTLTALLQGNMTSASAPLTIQVKVRTNCFSFPTVINRAEVYTASGDNNPGNDVATVNSNVAYNFGAANIGLWTGATSNDWFDCRNWTGGVIPSNSINVDLKSSNVVINPLSPYAPADKIARCNNLVIDTALNLSIINSGNLRVAGNFSNNGNFSCGTSTVSFVGAVSGVGQNIYDTSNSTTFHDLSVNSTNGSLGVIVPDGFGLYVNNNVTLTAGNLRLMGSAQLIQSKSGVSGNGGGTGLLLRDQQGQSNMFSYNYWSSPVSNNGSYTVSSVLRDGTNPLNPQVINWTSGNNAIPGNPMTLSSVWIYKYQNQTNAYANWSYLGQNATLTPGQGFTLKGSGASTSTQNYTFAGKPNSGDIYSNISANNLNLGGNPYPSALDANAFIVDNQSAINGVLKFWQQYDTNASHFLASYEGGYASYTLTGGTPPVSPPTVSTMGSSTRIPGRFIPVGQGFMVTGNATGGQIIFKNSQRSFVKETNANSNEMFRTTNDATTSFYKKMRLDCTNSIGNVRQLLLGFMGSEASNGFDYGYDAPLAEAPEGNFYFVADYGKLIINGLGEFDSAQIVPVGVNVQTGGIVKFSLSQLENFDESSEVYLYDNLSGILYDLKNEIAQIDLAPGIYDDRFAVRFTNESLKVKSFSQLEPIIYYKNSQINISTSTIDENFTMLEIYNLIGQKVKVFSDFPVGQNVFAIDAAELSSGNYLVKLSSGKNTFVKKMAVK